MTMRDMTMRDVVIFEYCFNFIWPTSYSGGTYLQFIIPRYHKPNSHLQPFQPSVTERGYKPKENIFKLLIAPDDMPAVESFAIVSSMLNATIFGSPLLMKMGRPA